MFERTALVVAGLLLSIPVAGFPDSGQRTADSRQRTANSGQRTADSGQRTTDSGQRTTDSGQRTTDSGPITVSAAVSLTDALEAIGAAYRAVGGDAVRFNFAGSNVLARQIVSGAPVDLFISADEAQMTLAEATGAVEKQTQLDLLGNRLAVVTPRGAARSMPNVSALLQPAVRRIAIGDPAAVPAGVYARQYLQAEGLWDRLQSRLVPVGNVRAALAAAANASADAAIVYETDAASSPAVDLAFVVSGRNAPRIMYPAAIVAASKHRAAAERFLTFLRGPAATAIFERFKFVPLAAVR
jgi:molybdate transport system substrate-binding protein